jgi:hypothetical protein
MKGLILVLGVALLSVGYVSSASAMSAWERALIQRYTSHEKCDGAGAPAWGRASMQRYRAAHRRDYR